jgi:hypothetical protein
LRKRTKIATVAFLVTVALLVSPYVYSILTAQKSFSNTMNVKGVGVDVLAFIDDTTPPTTSVTGHDWDTVTGGDTVYFADICVKNTGTQNMTLSFSTTLPANVGTVTWWVERNNGGTNWVWMDWGQGITNNTPYMIGSAAHPIQPNQVVGMRATGAMDNSLGHIRIAITVAANAPFGPVAPFDITVTGTEVA